MPPFFVRYVAVSRMCEPSGACPVSWAFKRYRACLGRSPCHPRSGKGGRDGRCHQQRAEYRCTASAVNAASVESHCGRRGLRLCTLGASLPLDR